MTKPIVTDKFSLGLDNYSLRQSSNIGEELTRNDLVERIEVRFDHLQARFDRILILLEAILNEMQKV